MLIPIYKKNYPNYKTENRLSDLHVTHNDVIDILINLNINKITLTASVSPYIIKSGAEQLAPSLAHLFNYFLNICQIPEVWKAANVIKVYNKGDNQDITNYRPVSLLSVVMKCFEKIVFKLSYNFLHKNKRFTVWQSSFTPGDSIIKLLINMYHTFAQALDNKKEVSIAFCDVSTAFDHGLLYKLEFAGISGNLFEWYKNYLNQKVVMQGQSSSGKAVGAGVP